MVPKCFTLKLLAIFILASQTEAQLCVPGSVVNMSLSNDLYLTFEVDKDEKCMISQFLVYIFRPDHPVEYSFEVDATRVSVSFLPVCQEWTFVVVPISGYTRGQEHSLLGFIPIPYIAKLTIGYINVTRNIKTNEAHLTWDLEDTKYGDCSVRYRVTIEEDDNPDIHDIYTNEKSINLHFLSPCTNYQIGIRAINVANPTIEGALRSRYYEVPALKQSAPRLETLELSDTSFNMTWELETRLRNRCEVSEFYLNGGSYFNRSIIYDDNLEKRFITVSVNSLKPNSMYYLHASVQNTAGWSNHSVVAVQTLQKPPEDSEIVDVDSMWRYV